MAVATTKKRILKYLSRDFQSLRSSFIEHLKIYFPNDYNDFNESSVGMLLTELGAYFGDNMSFYLDKRFNESFIDTASESKNVLKHAKQLGFKVFGKTAASGVIDCFLVVPATYLNGQIVADMRFAGKVKKGAKIKSINGRPYETIQDADFSLININDSNFVQVAKRDNQTNQPLTFALKLPNIQVIAGETKTAQVSVGSYKRFQKITLSDADVLEIISMIDSEGNEWTEVDFLCQDTVFISSPNLGQDSTDVPYVLKLKSVPFRFVTEYDIATNKMSIRFGTGDAQEFDGDLIPDLGELSLPTFGKDTFTDFSLDPQNFLKTRTLGLAPVNTTLTIKYRVGGGTDTNAGSGEINTATSNKIFEVSDSSLSANLVRDVSNSFAVINSQPVQGGNDALDVEEIKQLIPTVYSSQSRVVTPPDFIARTLSMPAKFGSVFRANARLNPLNPNSVELIILSRDSNRICFFSSSATKRQLKNIFI